MQNKHQTNVNYFYSEYQPFIPGAWAYNKHSKESSIFIHVRNGVSVFENRDPTSEILNSMVHSEMCF